MDEVKSEIEQVWERAEDPRWLLFLLDQMEAGSEQIYRAFAHRCAERSLTVLKCGAAPGWRIVLKALDDYDHGRITSGELWFIGQKLGNAATAAGSVGLRHGASNAAVCLAIFHATHPDALRASWFAAHYGAMAFRLRALRQGLDGNLTAAEAARTEEKREQARVLRRLAGDTWRGNGEMGAMRGVPLLRWFEGGYVPDPYTELDLPMYVPILDRDWSLVRQTRSGLAIVRAV